MLMHKFFIVNSLDYNYEVVSKNNKAVEIPDDLIIYFSDSMKWIKTKWNGKEEHISLNYYGMSIIDDCNLIKFVSIIEKYRDIFREAPQILELTGMYMVDCDCYEKIVLEKALLLDTLDDLIRLGKKAIENNCALLHMGV